MLDNLQNLETAIEGFLAREQNPTTERIRELIGQFRQMPFCAVDDAAAEKLARVFEERHGVTMTIGAMLTDAQYQPWLDTARASITPYYWDRYKKLLSSKKMSSQVIATLDNVTDRILGLLENPDKPGNWYRRGMVVGHVQSGKTGNYIGLLCKAADAGYKLIVVIAGIHNNLRNQTQLRIDEGFVGRDSARLLSKKDERFIGVGRFDQTRRPVTFTNSVRDFNKQMATGLGVPLQNLKEPAVLVIKKNSSTLARLLEWLREHSAGRGGTTVDAPMLLIDDEADNASINIRHGAGEVSRINGQIRDLLKLFEKRCYVGYTATPFANIFIDPDTTDAMLGDDLFPRNFIVSLDPPSNYFGPAKVFLSNDDKIVRSIADHGDTLPLNHPITTVVNALPESLVKATRAFIVARAIRLARGHHGSHCSMLVNSSRFTGVQTQIRNELHSFLQRIQASCRVFGALPPKKAMGDPEIAALRAVWEEQYSEAAVDWPDVQKFLHDAAAPVIVTERLFENPVQLYNSCMNRKPYPSDLTEPQWQLIAPLLPAAKLGGRPREVDLCDVLNAIFYLNREGCSWRAIPHDFPHWRTVYDYFAAWKRDGTWEAVNAALRRKLRVAAGRPHTPTTASIDSQTVKATENADSRGYDGAKKLTGRKRHIVVDSLGLLLAVAVTTADVADAVAARPLLAPLTYQRFPRLRVVRADSAYGRYGLPEFVAQLGHFLLALVKRPLRAVGFVLLPARWVVERTFAWLGRYRRHSRDYERQTESSEAMLLISMIHHMARRLEPGPKPTQYHYRPKRRKKAA